MKAFRLKGSSMFPLFKEGGAALVGGGRPAAGDCAVYSYMGRTLLHRVVRTSASGAWLADDAGRLEPHFVPWARVRGRAHGGLLAGGLPGLAYCKARRVLSALLLRGRRRSVR
jgi:hypothetical protein